MSTKMRTLLYMTEAALAGCIFLLVYILKKWYNSTDILFSCKGHTINMEENEKKPALWKRLINIVPGYARLPLLGAIALNTLTFNGTRAINKNRKYHDMTTDLDRKIPLTPKAVFIYVGAFVQWIVGYTVAARDGKDTAKRVIGADVIAKAIVLACFLIYPTEMERPGIDDERLQGKGLDKWLTRFIYKADAANNLFPSIHCLESWMIFRSCDYLKKKPPFWYKPVMFVAAISVFASTVLLKQHVLADIPSGVGAAEAGYAVMNKLMKK